MNFDIEIYKLLNKDLDNENKWSDDEYKLHYMLYGIREGRKYNINDVYPDFNHTLYRNNYEDLSNMNDIQLELHFLNKGKLEKRSYSDTKKYIISPHLMGGLCNQMFQIASAYGEALKYNKSLVVTTMADNPHSSIDYFGNIFRKVKRDMVNIQNIYKEPDDKALRYCNIPNLDSDMKIFGYFQNEQYFMKYRKEILDLFSIESSREEALKNKYVELDNSYFIHIRRGDYVNNDFHYIDLTLYYKKCIEYIKGVHNNAKFYVFSNDIEYCKGLEWLVNDNIIFIENLDEIDSLYLMSMCKYGGICCNSSYSWWAGYLNKNEDKIVIYPNRWFNSDWEIDIGWKGCKIMNIIDYSIHTNVFDLSDTTIIIPVRIDHNDRLVNLTIILKYLTYFFNTNIIIIENGITSNYEYIKSILPKDKLDMIDYEYQYSTEKLFHRMKILNECLAKVKTQVVANYDVDCLLELDSYMECQNKILSGKVDVMHPFNNPPGVYYIDIEDKDKIDKYNINKMINISVNNIAGNGFIVFFRTSSYRRIGGENENFMAYGPEDNERIYRAIKFGLKYERLNKPIYHLEHYRSPNSSNTNPYFIYNTELFEKIKNMNMEDLKTYYNFK
jgi:hypothetical protein